MKLFHRHEFDPKLWTEVSRTKIARQIMTSYGLPSGEFRTAGSEIVYSNTCTSCGDLVFRRVKEIED